MTSLPAVGSTPVVAFFKGTTRAVLCVGRLAIKFARSPVGARGNQYEANLYQRSASYRRVLLCPPLYCFPLGVVLVMRRAGAMTEAEYREHVRDAGLMLRWDYLGPGDESSPSEPKANAWGWLDGKPVAVDYANLANLDDAPCPR